MLKNCLIFCLSICIMGCNPNKTVNDSKINVTDIKQPKTPTIIHSAPVLDTVIKALKRKVDGQQFVIAFTNKWNLYIMNTNGDTVFIENDSAIEFEFKDFNNDSHPDIQLYYTSNIPGLQNLLLYDRTGKTFIPVGDIEHFPSPTNINGTRFYYSYHRSGCADLNWDSDLFYITNYKAIRIGNISGVGCGDKLIEDAVLISRVNNNDTMNIIDRFPITIIDHYKENKWGFIKDYWTKNYKKFL